MATSVPTKEETQSRLQREKTRKRKLKKKETREKKREKQREKRKANLKKEKRRLQQLSVNASQSYRNNIMTRLKHMISTKHKPKKIVKIENTNQPIISRRTEKSRAAKLIQQRFRKNINNSLRFRKNINNSSMSAKSRKKKCLKQLRDCDASNKIERGKSPISYYERKAKNNPKCGRLYNKCMGEKSGYEPDLDRPSYYGNSDYLSNSQ